MRPRKSDPQQVVGQLVPAVQQMMLPLQAAPLLPEGNRWEPAALLADWLATRRSRYTARAYLLDVKNLAGFLQATQAGAVELLLAGQPQAELIVEHWDAHSRDRDNASPATRCRRIRAIGSFLRHARRRGAIGYCIEVQTPAPIPRRDTSGPPHRVVDEALVEAATSDEATAPQDAALLALLYGLALRHGEVLSMRLCDCDIDRQRLMIVAKGRLGQVPVRRSDGSLVDPTAVEPDREQLRGVPAGVWRLLAAHLAWLRSHRDDLPPDGPLWWSIQHDRPYGRMGRRSMQQVIDRWLQRVGAPSTTPHGLRHAAVTKLLDMSHGNLRLAAGFARHADTRHLARYDDGRRGLFMDGASIVADAIE